MIYLTKKYLRFFLSNYVLEKIEFAKLCIRVLLIIDVPYAPALLHAYAPSPSLIHSLRTFSCYVLTER